MSEKFLVRTNGGPHAINASLNPGPWPLPEELICPCHPNGKYVKTKESQLPEQEEGSFIVRGAEYDWKEPLINLKDLISPQYQASSDPAEREQEKRDWLEWREYKETQADTHELFNTIEEEDYDDDHAG